MHQNDESKSITYISVVIPVYNACDVLDELYDQIRTNIETYEKPFEVIFKKCSFFSYISKFISFIVQLLHLLNF